MDWESNPLSQGRFDSIPFQFLKDLIYLITKSRTLLPCQNLYIFHYKEKNRQNKANRQHFLICPTRSHKVPMIQVFATRWIPNETNVHQSLPPGRWIPTHPLTAEILPHFGLVWISLQQLWESFWNPVQCQLGVGKDGRTWRIYCFGFLDVPCTTDRPGKTRCVREETFSVTSNYEMTVQL